MEISGLTLHNASIHYESIHLSFEGPGLFLLRGEMGSGKTSLLESILFGKTHVSFSSPHEQWLYERERYNLFSYVPQRHSVSELSVREYLTKWNQSVTEDEIITLFEFFSLRKEILEQDYAVLSGGEREILCVLAAALKDTPYLILDEPSNHLDDQSVALLQSYLEKEAEKRTVILASHDPRLSFPDATEFHMEKEKGQVALLRERKRRRNPTGISIRPNRKPSFMGLAYRISRNGAYVITILCTSLLFSLLTVFTHDYFHFHWVSDSENKNMSADAVLEYMSGGIDPMIREYAKGEGIDISGKGDEFGNSEYNLRFSELETYTKIPGVQHFYLFDEVYLDYLGDVIEGRTQDESLLLFSMPEQIMTSFAWQLGASLIVGLNYIQGDYPRDNAGEIVLSENMLTRHFSFSPEEAKDALGKSVNLTVDGREKAYTVVGIGLYDIAVISYEEGHNFGTLSSLSADLEAYAGRMQAHRRAKGFDDEYYLGEVLFITEPGKERQVLNYLVEHYPGNLYTSRYWGEAFSKYHNIEKFPFIEFVNLGAALLFALCAFFINKNSIRKNADLLRDVGNYYINRRLMFRLYSLSLLTGFLFFALLAGLAAALLSRFAYLLIPMLLQNVIIICLPLLLWVRHFAKERGVAK